jgi:hypothetical protein
MSASAFALNREEVQALEEERLFLSGQTNCKRKVSAALLSEFIPRYNFTLLRGRS